MHEYLVKRVENSDLSGINNLSKYIYGKSLDDFSRKFNTNNFGAKMIGYVAYRMEWKNNPLSAELPIAYYGVYPMVATIDNKDYICAQSGDTMTHPDFRGRGLFIELAKKTYELAYDNGIAFIFGFPVAESYGGFKKKLNWKFPYKMKRFIKFIPTFPLGLASKKYKFMAFTRDLLFVNIAKIFFNVLNFNDAINIINNGIINNGIKRDRDFFLYKSNSLRFLQHKNIIIVIKYDGVINIGDIIGVNVESDIKDIINRLALVAFFSGVNFIKSYYSPGAEIANYFVGKGFITESLPYGYCDLYGGLNLDKLLFSYIDYDTY